MRALSGARGAAAAALAGVALCVALAGCGEKRDDGTTPAGAPSLPALMIQEDTPNLLLTWVDSRGDTHSALHPSEVPAEGKELVRVVIADREEGTRDPLYVVDLTKPSGDGAFAARAMSRREWESVLEKRRDAYLGKLAPKTAAPPASGEPSAGGAGTASSAPATGPNVAGLVVVIYGAEWCKPCHQAADYLKSKGIAFVMKDVEEDRAAAREMSEKLEKAGRRGGAIPVIDVRGQILVGYSRSELDRAIAKAGSGTVL
ncbi:MAG: glutaredoxin domain-containing protein [Polyangiaceae bacterium]